MTPALRKSSPAITLMLILPLILSCGITSRYRLDLFVQSEEMEKKVDVESTQFVKDAVLSDPFQDVKYVGGDGDVAVVTVGTRWNPHDNDRFTLLGFDEYWRCRIFLQLPDDSQPGQLGLHGASFLQLLGHYQLPPEEKIFLPKQGSVVVDSVTSDNVFVTIDAVYASEADRSVKFTGQFKVKSSD